MRIFAGENDDNTRLDSVLSELSTDLSRSKIQNFIKSGYVKVNGTNKNTPVTCGSH